MRDFIQEKMIFLKLKSKIHPMRIFKIVLITSFFIFWLIPIQAQITEIGMASFYADKFDGRVTASGAIFDQAKLTAAHRTLPFGTTVKVTNLENRNVVSVIINDRGPFVKDRVIDLSKAAAKELGFINSGIAKVKLEVEYISASSNKSSGSTVKSVPKESRNETASESVTSKQNTVATESFEYYSIKSEAINPTGFGVQVASYQEAANLMKLCNELSKKTNKDIIVQVGNTNGNKLYRVIVGTFPTREMSSSFLERNKSDFPGSFVLGL